MSIVKMKRLRLLSLTSERDHLLARLQRAGCVEVTEPEEPQSMPEWGSLLRRDSTALLTVKSQATTVRTALENVNRYAAVRSGLFIQREAIREQDFFRQETDGRGLGAGGKDQCLEPAAGKAPDPGDQSEELENQFDAVGPAGPSS